MILLSATWLVACDDDFTIIKNGSIVFDEKIIDIGETKDIIKKYPNLKEKHGGANSILMPGLINSHIHLEFCSNKTTLKYGNFMEWLNSVISNRDELVDKASTQLIDNELKQLIKNGTTTIGAISSFGFDFDSCIKTPLNVVYFTEAIGSRADMIDTLFIDFKSKLQNALSMKSDNFIPAIAIHSPYSVHPFFIRDILKIAKQKNLAVSAHFQESKAENQWLNYSMGEFKEFFENFLMQSTAVVKPKEFLELFKGIKKLSFTHCVEANKDEIDIIKNLDASIIHCPNSNRLLNNTSLDLTHLSNINLALATDGLSSNISLSLFDEMRNAFFIHTSFYPNIISKKLILAVTKNANTLLGLNKGSLQKGKDADIITFNLPDNCQDKDDLITYIILHTKNVYATYIKGTKIEFS
jgi:cytosine/adenosine deaminase-related metal-dependent hydrolase